MTEPQWLRLDVILAIHEEQLKEHGGLPGCRDMGLLESALARPQHQYVYSDGPPALAKLAAAYAYGIARNHPFIDGNKRTAFVACELFLQLNSHTLTADDADCATTMLDVASGKISEDEFSAWISKHLGT